MYAAVGVISAMTFVAAVALGMFYCKQGGDEGRRGGGGGGDSPCPSGLVNLGGGGTEGRGPSKGFKPMGRKAAAANERAVELARFERMGQRSDAYPTYGGSKGGKGTVNPFVIDSLPRTSSAGEKDTMSLL